MHCIRSLCLVAAAAWFSAASSAQAFELSSDRWSQANFPVRYRINMSSVPPELGEQQARLLVDSGFAAWATPECTAWRATNAGTTNIARGNSKDTENSVLWISDRWPAEFGSPDAMIGATTVNSNARGNILNVDIEFNNVGFSWAPDRRNVGTRSAIDPLSVITHEEGHFLGLNHSKVPNAVMYGEYGGAELRQELTGDDVMAVCSIYPSGRGSSGTATPVDPCHALNSCEACVSMPDCGWCGTSTATCKLGGQTAPVRGVCDGPWIATDSECPTKLRAGTTAVGKPCTGNADCVQGAACAAASDGAKSCLRTCSEDCDCPESFHCDRDSAEGQGVCAPGTNLCKNVTLDAGSTGRDASASDGSSNASGRPRDGGTTHAEKTDASPSRPTTTNSNSMFCACTVLTGRRETQTWWPVALAACGFLLGLQRRRCQCTRASAK